MATRVRELLGDTWERLVEPSGEVRDVAQRRRARFLCALLVVATPLGVLGFVQRQVAASELERGAGASLLGLLSFALAYALARSSRPRLGAWVAVVAASAAPYSVILSGGINATLIGFLALAVVLAGIVMPFVDVVIVASVNAAAVALLPLIAPGVVEDPQAATSLMVLAGVVVVLGVRHRDELERIRRAADRGVALGTLAAGIGHEINNPLAYVTMNLDLLQEHLRPLLAEAAPEQRAELERALADGLEGAGRVRTIIDDLRALTGNDDDGPSVAGSVPAALAAAERLARAELRRAEATVVHDLDAVPPVTLSESRLCQVFLNVIVNAAHAVADAGTKSEIHVRGRRAGSMVVVEIRDHGVGIPPNKLRRVFDPFFTTKPAREGTGLGLAISRTTVHAAGGDMSLSSRVGKGTVVRIELPVATTAPATASPEAEDQPPQHASAYRAAVLIAEDEERLATALARALPEHDVTLVHNGEDAINRCLVRDYDVVVCDLMLGQLGGDRVYESVERERPGYAERFLFITGGAKRDEVAAFLSRVPNRVLCKPIAADAFADAVADHIRKTTRPSATAAAPRVLLVDDDAMFRDLVGALACPLGLAFRAAGSGDAAMRAVEEETFDLVLLDEQLGGEDGVDVARRLRAAALPRDAKIVAITGGRRGPGPATDGFDGVDAKPHSTRELEDLLARWTGPERGFHGGARPHAL